jgi:hypothetical protein
MSMAMPTFNVCTLPNIRVPSDRKSGLTQPGLRLAGHLRDSVVLCCAQSRQLQRTPRGKLLKFRERSRPLLKQFEIGQDVVDVGRPLVAGEGH